MVLQVAASLVKQNADADLGWWDMMKLIFIYNLDTSVMVRDTSLLKQ